MGLLFAVLAVIAVLIFVALPFWAGVGYLVVLAWSAFLLYLIFYKPDLVSKSIVELDTRETESRV